jgi:hypothetical protein
MISQCFVSDGIAIELLRLSAKELSHFKLGGNYLRTSERIGGVSLFRSYGTGDVKIDGVSTSQYLSLFGYDSGKASK